MMSRCLRLLLIAVVLLITIGQSFAQLGYAEYPMELGNEFVGLETTQSYFVRYGKPLRTIIFFSVFFSLLFILAQGPVKSMASFWKLCIMLMVAPFAISHGIIIPFIVMLTLYWLFILTFSLLGMGVKKQKFTIKLGMLGIVLFVFVVILIDIYSASSKTANDAVINDNSTLTNVATPVQPENFLDESWSAILENQWIIGGSPDRNPYANENAQLFCNPERYLKDNIISTGSCQFGGYKVEFFQYLKDPRAYYICEGRLYCGTSYGWKDATDDENTNIVVTDAKGQVVVKNITEPMSLIRLLETPIDFPFMVLLSENHGAGGYAEEVYGLYTSDPIFRLVSSITSSPWGHSGHDKGFYIGDRGEILLNIVDILGHPFSAASYHWMKFSTPYQFVDDHFERATSYIERNRKVYTDDELKEIHRVSKNVNKAINDYVLRALKHGCNQNIYDPTPIDQIKYKEFYYYFASLVHEGRTNMAWDFFETSIPDSYDFVNACHDPSFGTKSIIKSALRQWINNNFPLGEKSIGKAETEMNN